MVNTGCRYIPNNIVFRFVLFAGFVRKLDTDVSLFETVYKTAADRWLFVKFVSMNAMQELLKKNMDPRKFHYSSGNSVEVQMTVAGCYVSNIKQYYFF